MNAVDTNVLVYAIDRHEPRKQTEAVSLLRQLGPTDTVLLWQVAGEYLCCLRRFAAAGTFPDADVETEIVDLLRAFSLVLPTREVIQRSLSLSSRYSLSHWDSMLIAACLEAGVDTLYSEDLDDGMTYQNVTVVNPFA